MIDSLIQHLVDEIAMDGHSGTSVTQLRQFTRDYYLKSRGRSPASPPPSSSSRTRPRPRPRSRTYFDSVSQPTTSTLLPFAPPPTSFPSTTTTTHGNDDLGSDQVVDEPLFEFVWSTLVQQPDVSVGVLVPVLEPRAQQRQQQQPSDKEDGDDDDDDGDVIVEDEENKKKQKKDKKGKGKELGDPDEERARQYEIQVVPRSEGMTSSRRELFAKYGRARTRSTTDMIPEQDGEGGGTQGQEAAGGTRGRDGTDHDDDEGEEFSVRVVAGEETIWKAITGSHARPTSITPKVLEVLQLVSSGRTDGATAVRISRELNVDPKSVFHYVKVPVDLGIVKKIPAIDGGARTNRILHERYLSSSPHWSIHTMKDPTASIVVGRGDEGQDRDEGEEEEGGGGGQARARGGGGGGASAMTTTTTTMSIISGQFVGTNPNLVMGRVVRALEQTEQGWMVHSEIAPAIGLHTYSKQVQRRLNSLITLLAHRGVCEKIAVRKNKGKGEFSTAQGLRLVEGARDKFQEMMQESKLSLRGVASNVSGDAAGEKRQGRGDDDEENEEEEEEEGDSYPLANESMSRQILQLVLEAGETGVTIVDISDALGHYSLRTIDATLQRLGRTPPPRSMRDRAICSVHETVGRMKHTRWFSVKAYVAMRRRRGVPDVEREREWADDVRRAYWDERAETKGKRALQRELGEGREDGARNVDGQGVDEQDVQGVGTSTGTENRTTANEKAGGRGRGKGRGKGKGKAGATARADEGTQFASWLDQRLWIAQFDTFEHAGVTNQKGGKPRGGRPRRVKQEGEGEADGQARPGDGSGRAGELEPRPPPKPRGRPRKHPIVEGKEGWYARRKRLAAERIAQGLEPEETYYERKKREEREDREREMSGLPPIVRAPRKRASAAAAARGKKKGKVEEEEEETDELQGAQVGAIKREEEQVDTETSAPSATSTPAPTPGPSSTSQKRGRPSRAASTVELSKGTPADGVVEPAQVMDQADEPQLGPSPPPPPPRKKRGRPSKADLLKREEEKRLAEEKAAADAGRRVRKEGAAPSAAESTEQREPKRDEGSEATPDRPRKRTRLSSAVDATTPSHATAPTSQADATAETPASEHPASTPSRAPERPTSTPTPTPRQHPRLQVVVEIEVRPGSDMDLKLRREAAEAQARRASAGGTPPVAPPAVTAPVPSTPKQTPQPEVSTSALPANGAASNAIPRARDLDLPTPPAHLQRPPSSTQSLVATSIKKKKYTGRASIASKENLTALARQQELIDYLHATGGVLEAIPRLNELLRDHARAMDPSAPTFLMDRHMLNSALASLVRQDRLRKTSTMGTRGGRHDIYYLPSLAIDSPEVTKFLQGASDTTPVGKWNDLKVHHDATLDESNDLDDAQPGNPVDAPTSQGKLTVPDPSEDPVEIKDFFRRQPMVLGASYGVRNGAFSRARQLHKWLASFIFHGSAKEYLAAADDQGYVLTHATFVSAMPVVVFTSIVPLPVESDELKRFLADEANLGLALQDVPSGILRILRPSFNKRKRAVWTVLSTLMTIGLLSPLAPAEVNGAIAFVTPSRAQSATHWRFNAKVPIYAFADKTVPLVSVSSLTSLESVTSFWAMLQRGSAGNDPESLSRDDPAVLAQSGFPLNFKSSSLFLRQINLHVKWKDSYHLIPYQRSFLVKLIHADPALISDTVDRSADLEHWADCLFAPYDTVVDYLHLAYRRSTTIKPPRKKRRVRQAQAGEEDEWEDVGEEGGTDVAAALHKKVKDASAQRERDWTTIVDKFRADHEQPTLNAEIVDYLHRRFIDPRRQIDAVQLMFELRQLLPAPYVLAGDETLKTVVPLALRRRAKQADDPYTITRQPTIRKRARIQRPKGTPRPSVNSGNGPVVPLHPIEYGDQNEFLSTPAAPRPTAEAGRRVRNFYTMEQDELLLDAVAVLRARAQSINARISYLVLEKLFKGHKASVLRTRSLTLLKKVEEQAYHDRLVDAWLEVYHVKRTEDPELADPNPKSMTDFDIASFIRCLRKNVDKRLLRLTRSVARAPPPSLSLPASLAELRSSCEIALKHEVGRAGPASAARWDYYWVQAVVAGPDRDKGIAQALVGTEWTAKKATHRDTEEMRIRELTSAAVKMVISTSEAAYVPELGAALLEPFEEHVDDVVKSLKDHHVIISSSSEEDRRVPGRNFSFDDRFLDRLDSSRVTMDRLNDAQQFDRALKEPASSFEGVFPVVPTEGETMALVDLVSEGKVDLSIDTSTLTDKATNFGNFATRQANDDDIECFVNIDAIVSTSSAPASFANAILPDPVLPKSFADVLATIDNQAEALASEGVTAEGVSRYEIWAAIDSAGIDGITIDGLCSALPNRDRQTLRATLASLRRLEAPLVLETGFAQTVYVSTRYLSSWTIALPPLAAESQNNASEAGQAVGPPVVGTDASRRLVEPTMWTGVDGKADKSMWTRAQAWVRGILWRRSGLTLDDLATKLTDRNHPTCWIMSLVELRQILRTLERSGVVSRDPGGTEPRATGAGEREIDWDEARWRLAGTFW
ncbi:hypothetical protein JCM10212_005957 [Sporobolomyces blumeae]